MSPALRRLRPWLALPLAVAAVTAAGRLGDLNPTTVGFLYFLAILGLATWGGWKVGVVASVGATLSFNYFFFPPFHTFVIHDPANWVALLAFLVAATLVSRLVTTARREAEEAERRRTDVETLYELTFGLFAASQRPRVLAESAARTLQAIGAKAGQLFAVGSAGDLATVVTIGEALPVSAEELARARTEHRVVEVEGGLLVLPLEVGGSVKGLLVAREPDARFAVLAPACRLLALAIERERLLTEAARLEGVRESEALKTALLRALSHDLRTPLTAMRLEIESLEQQLAGREQSLASVERLALEQERLARRVDNLLALARLEAGVSRPHPEPTPAGSLFASARESLHLLLAGREVATRVEPGCPDLQADPSLALEILVNLLENAARWAPRELPLELAARRIREGRVVVEVTDRGPGLPAGARETLDSASGGLGLRIARSFAEAMNGSLVLLDRPGGGTVARLELPAARDVEEAA